MQIMSDSVDECISLDIQEHCAKTSQWVDTVYLISTFRDKLWLIESLIFIHVLLVYLTVVTSCQHLIGLIY